MSKYVEQILPPVYDGNSKVLILGTIPSPKSREYGFFYMHPQNRFWKVMSAVLEEPFPETIEQKKKMFLKRGVAIWDVLKSCEISGAEDSSIKNPVPNPIEEVLEATQIKAVFTTGKKADALYQKLCYPKTKMQSICLPSTSPANCACKWDTLLERYSQILKYLA